MTRRLHSNIVADRRAIAAAAAGVAKPSWGTNSLRGPASSLCRHPTKENFVPFVSTLRLSRIRIAELRERLNLLLFVLRGSRSCCSLGFPLKIPRRTSVETSRHHEAKKTHLENHSVSQRSFPSELTRAFDRRRVPMSPDRRRHRSKCSDWRVSRYSYVQAGV